MALRSATMPPVPLDVYIDGQMLPQVSTHRNLGLVVDGHLTSSAHVQSVTAKVSQRLGLLWRLRNRLSGLVLRELYTTCIRPVLEHSSVVWSGISSTDSVELERLNRKAARLISNTKCRSDTPHDIYLLVLVYKNSHTGATFPSLIYLSLRTH